MDGVRLWLESRSSRALIAAVVAGFALRLAWAVWATRAPPGPFSDPARYQQIAQDFADGRTMALGSIPSAFWPPGYPLALAPLAWISEHTGAISVPFAASLLNVVAGTATVALTGVLASMWIGTWARAIAAWIMAVAPGPVVLTSVALSETLFTAVALLVVVLSTLAIRRRWQLRRVMGIGLLVGFAVLVRSPGAVLLAAPLLVARASGGSWRSGLRPTVALLAGAVLVLAPWTVRNGVEVGIWTPLSTNNVAFLCTGNGDGADGTYSESSATAERCFTHSPFDNPRLYEPGDVPAGFTLSRPDEQRWYASTTRATTAWMVRHPFAQPSLVANRLDATFGAEREALNDAEGFGERPLVGPRARRVFQGLGHLWLWSVIGLAGAGLLLVGRCRRAVPLWGIAGLQVLLVLPGLGIERYHQPIVPFLAVLAVGVLIRARRPAPGVPLSEETPIVAGSADHRRSDVASAR
jgi:hypothetical protein